MAQSTERERLIFMAHSDLRVMILRPIGRVAAEDLVEQFFTSLSRVEQPWLYHRLVDVRRYEGHFSAEHVAMVAKRWQTLRGRHASYAHVALVSPHRCDRWHAASPLPGFPNETLCRFTSYPHAFNWLTAADRHAYLAQITNAPADSGEKLRPSALSGDILLD